MDFWQQTVPDPVAAMRTCTDPYDAYKYVDVATPDPQNAYATVLWVSRQPYAVIGRNCMDDTYDVLRAYGVPDLPPPVLHWFPNNWFATFDGTIATMTSTWRTSVAANPTPAVDSATRADHAAIAAVKPVWRTEGSAEWHDLQAQIAAESGTPSIRARALLAGRKPR